jgi:polysaccharide pyruvyl transferase WcaK-like protein
MSKVNVLLGGVPFGCNNIGDEAILEQVVHIVRSLSPNAEITVSTGEPESTAKLLNVNTTSLHAHFSGKTEDTQTFLKALDQADVFIWSGATGLSDYPEAGLDCLHEAQCRGVKTIVFCTGMNDTLNPAHFKLQKGKRRTLLNLLNTLSFKKRDFIKHFEAQKELSTRMRIKAVLDQCDLVINRDIQSFNEVMKSGLSKQPIVAADPAITLEPISPTQKIWGTQVMRALQSGRKKVGICISSQQQISDMTMFSKWLDQVINQHEAEVFFIPMNPETDFATMAKIRDHMTHADNTVMALGDDSPASVAGLAGEMDVIISSRLHLLIFASISCTPCIGIGRGSKVSNFLSEFGFCTAGDTQNIRYDYLSNELNKLLSNKSMYQDIADTVRRSMLARLDHGIEALGEVINPRTLVQ